MDGALPQAGSWWPSRIWRTRSAVPPTTATPRANRLEKLNDRLPPTSNSIDQHAHGHRCTVNLSGRASLGRRSGWCLTLRPATPGIAFRLRSSAILSGAEFDLDQRWSLFLDVKKAYLRTSAQAKLGPAPLAAKIRLDPTAISGGISYRF
ncbi:MAG: OmpW family outer membrane protein [Janthinobacterium lividum]